MVDKKKSINKYKDHCQREIVKAEKFAGDNTGGLTESGKKRAEGYGAVVKIRRPTFVDAIKPDGETFWIRKVQNFPCP